MGSSSPQTTDDIVIEETPRYNIIFWNDDKSDFEHVVVLLVTVFNYNEIESLETTKKIHEEGNAVVFTNSKEVCELRMEQCEKFKKEKSKFLKELKITLEKVS
jgi:ATP-dependent Clp protease adapter protein ClpS